MLTRARAHTHTHTHAPTPHLPACSFSVRGREKVGVCGRTGCGKSTLMITLYRLVEPTSGFIFVDGIDITTLGLADLRSRLSLVPQVRGA